MLLMMNYISQNKWPAESGDKKSLWETPWVKQLQL
jgi:hypothetical protein